MRSLLKAIVLSCAIHIMICLVLLQAPQQGPVKHSKSSTVEIQYDQPLQEISKPTSQSHQAKKGLVANKKLKSISALKQKNKYIGVFEARPQLTLDNINKGAGKTTSDIFTDTYADTPKLDNADAAWGVGAGTFARAKDYLLMKKVYEYVDNALFFPSFFHRNNIEGVINARLVINFEGKCDWSKIKFYGEQPYMKLFVLSVLKSACRQNFKPFLKDRLLTNVDLSFQFELTEHTNAQIIAKNKYIVGNALMFYRNSYKSVLEWEFGPFQGIFPVPAIYLNIPWIQENWEKIMYSKDPISEFKKEFGT